MPLPSRPTVAVGPVMPGWGSWDWVGGFLVDHLAGPYRVATFDPWDVPAADVVVIVKHAPPPGWFDAAARRAAVVYCPIDFYGSEAEIAADVAWLGRCARIAVHCRRLVPHFAPFAETVYADHSIKYAVPTRKSFRADGPLLWVGVRSNLPPLAAWVNANPLPAPLDVLTNLERPGELPTPAELGFRPDREVRVVEWSPTTHRKHAASARAALDVKGDDFRSRHKPPAKAIDFVASGVPLALDVDGSPAEHLAALGLKVPPPEDIGRWLSEGYWREVRRVGERLSRELDPVRLAGRFRRIVGEALEAKPAATSPGRVMPAVPKPDPVPAPPAPGWPKVYGLMVTRDDPTGFLDWCRDQLRLYDAVVCLDGSDGDDTARAAASFAGKLVHLRERDLDLPLGSDGARRAVLHAEIVRRFGDGHWVMCCRADEYCHHDPRKVAAEAERGGHDLVAWFVPRFGPHPDDRADRPWLRHLPPPERYGCCRSGGTPPREDRLYRCGPSVAWAGDASPRGVTSPAPFHPILRRFEAAEPAGPIADAGERFTGTFPFGWDIGDRFRPDPPDPPGGTARRYREARTLAAAGDRGRAGAILAELAGDDTAAPAFRALVANDLAALAAAAGDRVAAVTGFREALALDPGCTAARANLDLLGEPDPSVPPAGTWVKRRATRVAVLSLLFDWPTTGGGNVHTAELTRFLADAGYAVRHFYARFDPWRIGRVTGPTPHPAEAVEFAEAEWTAAGVVARFHGVLDACDPDWVVLTDSWNMKPLLADACGGRPYVLRLQALECLCPLNNVRLLPGPDGRARQCTRHQLATPDECARCVRERDRTSGDLHRAERALAGVGTAEYREALFRAFAGAAAVLAVNPLTAAMVEPHCPDVRVVTAGMDPARFPHPFPGGADPPRVPGRTRLLFAGLVREWMKGFDALRAAGERLWATRRDFEVVATDDAPEGGARPWERFVGWKSQRDLPACMAGADVVVTPTRAQEALGRTAVEAMAAGKPVVASRLGGLQFTVVDGATGLLCGPDDPADLAAKLATLLDDPALRERLGAAGRRRFEEHYSWPGIIDRHYRPLFGPTDRADVPSRPISAVNGPEVLVVVAHYAGRPAGPLVRLLDSMAARPAGLAHAVRVVVNRDGRETVSLPDRHRGVEVLYRENAGYNIGAWEAGWRADPPYARYLFLQDDCVVIRGDWAAAFATAAAAPGVGLVGECLSPDWDRPWVELAERFRGHELREHAISGRPAERVDCYLDFLRRRGIPPGPHGDHLQTLVLFADRAVLQRIDGFPACDGYGEAIGAEIGTSKRVQAAGLAITQVDPLRPFAYVEHPQWLHRRLARPQETA